WIVIGTLNKSKVPGCGLDDVYLPIRSNILPGDPLPIVKSTFAIISGEESDSGVVSNSTPSKPDATAFVSKGFDNKKLDLQKKEIVEIGNESGGLNLFNVDSALNCMTSTDCPNSICYVSKNLWHQRLGHPTDQVLDALKTKLLFDNNPTTSSCEVCHKAKQTTEPFPLSDYKSLNVGELVYLDLWGPYKASSKEGYKYFLTIVDDFSRVIWTFLMKSKTDVYENIVNFVNIIYNQFNKRIKVLRSDNGIKFVNKNMQLFCDKNGIIHQTSCAYTPQQNGIGHLLMS
ncbi:ribonuclease H-like domain-containing protein, partial [Tanacetum coccineum]